MKTFALADGDLVLSPQGYATVTGSAKISTELGLAMAEPFGDDRFHTSWGSYLPSYVGQPITSTTQLLVEAEVQRVLQAYIAVQRSAISSDNLQSSRTRFTTADVVSAVESVTIQQVLDALYVKVVLQTMSGSTITVNKVVNLAS